MKKSTANIIFIILIVFAGLALALLTSCRVTKLKETSIKDSTVLTKVDSGNVKNTVKIDENLQTWFKETYTLQPIVNNNDTTIEKYIYITKEGGTVINNKKETTIDSSWRKSLDSVKLVMQNMSKKSDVKVLSLWQIIGICLSSVTILFLLQNFSLKSLIKNIKP